MPEKTPTDCAVDAAFTDVHGFTEHHLSVATLQDMVGTPTGVR